MSASDGSLQMPHSFAANNVGATPTPIPSATPANNSTATGGGGGGGASFGVSSLYVGDLDATVDEGQLYDLFSQVAQVISVRVCRDQTRRSSLGYAYVNFINPQDAANAKELLNFTHLIGKPMRIMFSHRDPSLRKSGHGNVFIKNLDTSIDNKALYDTFATFGNVLSCKVAIDSSGRSRGYGFVQFEQEEAAESAIKRLDGMLINDKKVYVGHFVRQQERRKCNGHTIFTNVYVKNLPESTTDQELNELFGKYGTITSEIVMKDANGKSKCFGFVNFENPDSAAAAVEKLNDYTFGDKVLYVGKAQKKVEREAELKNKFEQERLKKYEKLQGSNLYLKNLDDNINEEKLKEIFSPFGTVASCKVMRDQHGSSKGSGFVALSCPEEAKKALNEMNGKMIKGKPLYVAIAQRKDERRSWLQAQFAQIHPGAISPVPAGMNGFHSPPQLFFGQGSPGLVSPQAAGFSYQQQLLPGMRPGVAPNFVVPYQMQRQGQSGQHAGGRRGGNTQQQQRTGNQCFGRNVANGRNNGDPQNLMSPIMAASPLEMQRSGPLPIPMLASALASATPENQRMMLGEQLYSLVDHIEHEHAGKVTGMLLEMDQTEVLHLIESPDALKKKVAEAMDVLRSATSGADDGGL
ncbi:hypothetical protein Leryth_012370 [Lithospermum erythrorhizon]|nr:hypothetical protein Leryth_012370 [Lithospermum erythrorhizon]